ALLRGGFMWHITSQHLGLVEAIRGPWGIHDTVDHMFTVQDSDGSMYIDDDLTSNKLEVLSGMYRTFTGM
ncbi:hypothetical protein P691DRAFT_689721, partial [Macrolepiota fuliginosa MF-IS2]